MSFQIVPGDPRSTVIVHVPHASREIPDEVRAGLLLDDEALARELDAMTDAFTDVVAQLAADSAGVRPWLFVNGLSRLVVDPERFPDEREEMNAAGMGAAYIRTCEGFNLRHDPTGLVEKYFDPYSRAFAELLYERMDAVASVTIIDLHSFPDNVIRLMHEVQEYRSKNQPTVRNRFGTVLEGRGDAARQSLWED